MGHAAIDQFNRGYTRLREEKLPDFIKKTSQQASLLSKWKEMNSSCSTDTSPKPSGPSPAVQNNPSPSDIEPPSCGGDDDTDSSSMAEDEGGKDSGMQIPGHDKADEVLDQIEDKEIEDNDELRSGSDLTFVIDPKNGRLMNDW